MAEGHEMANHTITHALLPVMNEANIAYELEQSKKEMLEQLGPKSQFSVEAPFGIDDPRVKDVVASRFPITRNWVLDDFMTGILRGGRTDPTTSTREYVQWQRGPLADTPLADMKGWVDTSLAHGIWLVLVIHGIEGVGWEPITTENLRMYFDYIASDTELASSQGTIIPLVKHIDKLCEQKFSRNLLTRCHGADHICVIFR